MTQTQGMLDVSQPPVTTSQLQQARKALLGYRVMAFVTGVVLITACVTWIFENGTAVNSVVWVAHGWLFIIYVVATALLGIKLRWPLARFGVVMLAGTIPTMSFVAEHFVTQAAQPSDVAA